MVLADLGKKINNAVSNAINSKDGNNESNIDLMLKEISTALIESDVNIKLVLNLRNKIKSKLIKSNLDGVNVKKNLIQKVVFDELVELVDTDKSDTFILTKKKLNIVMFVGLQGSGKTTSCTKFAVYYQRRGFKVGLICADTFRAGAFDQLKQNATRAKIPFFGSYTETNPIKVAQLGVEKFKREKFDLIIVDTSGRHKQEMDLFQEMVEIDQTIKPTQTIMVLDASIGQAAEIQSKAFKDSSNFGSIILTKLDGHAKGGGAISAVAITNTPIIFIGTGEHIQDFEKFQPKSFVSKLLGIGDLQGFMDHVQSLNFDNKDTLENFQRGKFTLNDFQKQMQNMLKMGPLTQIAGMIPGMGQAMEQIGEEETSNRLKRMVFIMDSMTKKELDSDGYIFVQQPERILRVARGSGTSSFEVELILYQQRMMSKIALQSKSMMDQQGQGQGQGQGQLPNLNPQQMQRGLQNLQSNPSLMNRMKSMLPGGQMPDMNEMMKMMQNVDMNQVSQMMQGMGGGAPGAPGAPGAGGAGGFPDMSQLMKQFGMG
ncbi:hypothetical protein WICMUC_004404 [Wickerhamomyces mucosus]|uniref:Signal recognition particle 54 kDa protein n=1 Tax=Wickerhamomyces mucosus TaxID=1378264 RepID=A0A9P8TB21_9ASCO|nr:hypothetical protein WICMUC_004404 [Wickerhamomyces mucosus]